MYLKYTLGSLWSHNLSLILIYYSTYLIPITMCFPHPSPSPSSSLPQSLPVPDCATRGDLMRVRGAFSLGGDVKKSTRCFRHHFLVNCHISFSSKQSCICLSVCRSRTSVLSCLLLQWFSRRSRDVKKALNLMFLTSFPAQLPHVCHMRLPVVLIMSVQLGVYIHVMFLEAGVRVQS